VRGRIPKKTSVQSSITFMGFAHISVGSCFCRSPEKCVYRGRQINVPGKFWNGNKGHMDDQEANTLYKCTVCGYHALHKWAGGGSTDFDAVSDEIQRWSSLSQVESQRLVSAEDGVLR
jgi:hypothetical protein